jgi:signal transduction histidine kinase
VLQSQPYAHEIRYVQQDGSIRYCQLQAAPLFDLMGKFIGHVGTVEDITAARAMAQMKNEFISVVSHELRTPLTALRGSLGMLANGVYDHKPAKGKRMLQIAAESADRLARLVSDILDLERLESGKITLIQQPCDAGGLMLQAIEALQTIANQDRITLSAELLNVNVWAAPDSIIQTLLNLLSNAIKFSEPGSTVWLSATLMEAPAGVEPHSTVALGSQCAEPTVPQAYVRFSVKDQGRGIPADKLETIFGQFQQVDASDSRQKGGTGLGLAICRSIVQQHGGKIWAESLLGEGSTFYFTLPLPPIR